jgi:tetratricopeptide (TPR) repeat protein
VAPYVEKFGATFPVAVDTADVFGHAFGLKAIPVTFLVDEVGIIRLQGGGPSAGLLRQIEGILAEPLAQSRGTMPQLANVQSRSALETKIAGEPDDWRSRLALAQLYDASQMYSEAIAQLEAAARIQPREGAIPFLWGLVLLHRDQRENALIKLREARDLDPENWRIRKQIWAIEHPEKFYTKDSPDFGWQKEELERERSAAVTPP